MAERWLLLTKSGRLDAFGCHLLRLALMEGTKEIDHVLVVSGAPGRQNFRTLADQVAGKLEPIPEGVYDEIGEVEWAGGVDNYAASWGSGLGPVWITLYAPRAIGLHLDANRGAAPGTAGCVGALDIATLRIVVGWFRKGKPVRLVVDWGLKSIVPVSAGTMETLKIYAHHSTWKVLYRGAVQPAVSFKVDAHDGKIGVALNGHQVEPVSLETVLKFQR